jgi:2,4-didehydro-3-deoxy-L-rhamnonate hydrolase
MRYIGYLLDGAVQVGALLDGDVVVPLGEVNEFWRDPHAAAARQADGSVATLALAGLEPVPPVPPGARVLCVGLNYSAHVDEGPFEVPAYPTVFGRWHASLSVSDVPVAVPVDEAGLDWEAELVAVVGRPLRLAEPDDALDAVFAYAAFNDITARRAQKLTTQWTVGKNVDASGPLSPFVTADEVGDPRRGLRVVTKVNGEIMQDGSTDNMLFGVGEIATGTPNGVGYARTPPKLLHNGDVVEVEIAGVGSVRTPVVATTPNPQH